jgi:CheY-like chemotaxis protein
MSQSGLIETISQPATLIVLVGALTALGALWYQRQRDMARQRQQNEALQTIFGELFVARSAAEIHRLLMSGLPALYDISAITIYSYNRLGGSLNALAPQQAQPAVVALEDTRSSDGLLGAFRGGAPRYLEDPKQFPCPVLWLPMLAEGERTGVLECRFASFAKRPDQTVRNNLQHLANQVAVALLLLDQREMREEILRGERLGAALELTSGVAAELQASVERIFDVARQMEGAAPPGPLQNTVMELRKEAGLAVERLERLVAYGRGVNAQPARFELNELVGHLAAFRRGAWRLLILDAEVALCPEQIPLLGSRGQMEQALLAVLVRCEQSLRLASHKHLRISTRVNGNDGVLRVEMDAPLRSETPGDGATEDGLLGLGMVRGTVESHKGQFLVESSGERSVLEIHLPLAGPPGIRGRLLSETQRKRSLTVLVCTALDETRRRVVESLASEGHRAVPAGCGAEALELAGRLRFDKVLAEPMLADMPWSELMDRLRPTGTGFVLLAHQETLAPAGITVVRAPFDRSALAAALDDDSA